MAWLIISHGLRLALLSLGMSSLGYGKAMRELVEGMINVEGELESDVKKVFNICALCLCLVC